MVMLEESKTLEQTTHPNDPLSLGRTATGRIVIADDRLTECFASIEQLEWQRKKTEHFRSESFLIPELAAEEGVILNDKITKTLNGEGQIFDRNTTGLGRASRELGNVVNRYYKRSALFKKGPQVSGKEFSLPNVAGIENIDYAGHAGTLFLRMVHDIVIPYETQPDDGYIVLNSRRPIDSYKTATESDVEDDDIAHLCSASESRFAEALNADRALTELKINDRVVALQKGIGDHTALLTVPAILNGVRLPVGSIMTVETDSAGDHKFAFGRLSAFCFESVEQGYREFAAVFSQEESSGNPFIKDDYGLGLNRFNRLVGRDAVSTQTGYELDEVAHEGALSKALEAVNEDRVARLLIVTDKAAVDVAQTANNDKKAKLASSNVISSQVDPNLRQPLRERLAVERLSIARTFGQAAIDSARGRMEYVNKLLKSSRATSSLTVNDHKYLARMSD